VGEKMGRQKMENEIWEEKDWEVQRLVGEGFVWVVWWEGVGHLVRGGLEEGVVGLEGGGCVGEMAVDAAEVDLHLRV